MIQNKSDVSGKKKPMILGIGGSGSAMLDELSFLPGIESYTLALVDTDQERVSRSRADVKITASSDWGITSGVGCGGDVLRGERAVARERHRISEMLKDASFLTVCGGLGGGTATGGIRTVCSVARALSLPAVFLVTMPFSFESYSRRHNAEKSAAELLLAADVLLTLPNDLLFAQLPPDMPAEQAFQQSAMNMAHTVFGVAELMRCKSLLGADYAAFMAPLKGKRCDCSLGVGIAESTDGLDRASIALERMLRSPFLGGMDQLKKADAAFLILSGGSDLQIAELKRTLEIAGDVFPKKLELFSGASVAESMNGHLQLTVITAKYTDIPAVPRNSGTAGKLRPAEENVPGILTQGEFSLTNYSRGIFETLNIPPTKYRDEDLDIPTFQRKNISIDQGRTGG